MKSMLIALCVVYLCVRVEAFFKNQPPPDADEDSEDNHGDTGSSLENALFHKYIESANENEIEDGRAKYFRTLQIEKKLREVIGSPTISNVAKPWNLPLALENELLRKQNEEQYVERSDMRMIAFHGEQYDNCPNDAKDSCVQFTDVATLSAHEVIEAELWFYITPKQGHSIQDRTFGLRNVNSLQNDDYFASLTMEETEGWLKFKVGAKHAVKNWLSMRNNTDPFVVAVSCVDCHHGDEGHNHEVVMGTNKPILSLSTKVPKRQRRGTRNRNRCSMKETRCCLQDLEVNFDDFPQFEFILAPRTIRVNYCRGECDHSDAMLGSQSTILTRDINRQSCCFPSEFDDMTVMISTNSTIELRTVPNLIVRECSCY